MSGVTKEQIAKAKEWDLLTYLQAYEPQELKKCGGSEYRTVTHDRLKISNGRWHWHSRDKSRAGLFPCPKRTGAGRQWCPISSSARLIQTSSAIASEKDLV